MYGGFKSIDFLNFMLTIYVYEWSMCSLENQHSKITIIISSLLSVYSRAATKPRLQAAKVRKSQKMLNYRFNGLCSISIMH